MEKEVERLYLNQMTQQGLYKTFGLRKIEKIQAKVQRQNHPFMYLCLV